MLIPTLRIQSRIHLFSVMWIHIMAHWRSCPTAMRLFQFHQFKCIGNQDPSSRRKLWPSIFLDLAPKNAGAFCAKGSNGMLQLGAESPTKLASR